jgi:hypothetical protein
MLQLETDRTQGQQEQLSYRRAEQVLPGGIVPEGRRWGEDGKGCGRVNMSKYCVQMYVNGKMRHVETIPRMGRGAQRRMMEGENSSMIYLIYCKNFYKCHNVPPPSTTIK